MECRLTRDMISPRVSASGGFWRPIGPAPGRGADPDIGDWELFTASIASDETRDLFIKDLATWITETPTNLPLTDLYDTTTGE